MKRVLIRMYFYFRKFLFPGSNNFWKENYLNGGTSGPGSYGELAEFKAKFLNAFVRENNVLSVIEFGCGDGNQVSYFDFPNYVGIDISSQAIDMCKEKNNKSNYNFYEYNPVFPLSRIGLGKVELTLSLDVIYHLVEKHIYLRHLQLLFESSEKFVAIYGHNSNEFFPEDFTHPREFTSDISRLYPNWELIMHVKNELSSWSDFYVYKKIA
jgi:hypothetical protein